MDGQTIDIKHVTQNNFAIYKNKLCWYFVVLKVRRQNVLTIVSRYI